MTSSTSARDVVVIGGGVIGCAIAYRLRRHGLSVAVLERERCGREASWASAGIIDPGSPARDDPLALLRRASVASYCDFIAELREQSGIDPQFLPCGSLDIITDDNQQAAAERKAAAAAALRTPDGRPAAELLSLQQSQGLEPELTRAIRGALLSRQAAQVRSPRLMAALVAACGQAGVEVHENTPAIDLVVRGSRVVGVTTASGVVSAGTVVLAAGAWSGQIAPRLAAWLPVHPVRGQILLLEMESSPFSHVLQHGKNYLVPRADGKILVGTTEEHAAGYHKQNTARAVAGLLSFAQRFVPALGKATWLGAWSGLRPGTPDGRPFIGPAPDLDGLLVATGHFRGGLTLAPITADLISAWILGQRTGHDLDPFLPGRTPPATNCSGGSGVQKLR